ncbi:MAG: hypothetical protein ACYC8T_03380 [Myxococcaceae bacterium]
MNTRALLVASLALLLTACPERIKRPTGDDLVVFGTVYQADGDEQGRGDPLQGATVRAAVDRNKDKAISADEAVLATTDEDGKYRLSMAVTHGETVVVSVRSDNTAAVIRTLEGGPKAEVELSPTLRALETLDCGSDTECLAGDKLKLGGLPSGVGGGARAFNPVTETAAFPGGFADDKGNLLVSGVFSAVQLTDSSGKPLEKLAAPADLRMTLPKETWRTVVDLTPGNDRIEVPLFAFNEASGQWVREGQGYLENEAGALLAEAKLASIRDGSFSGGVVVAGKVSHFSFWNVDWPIESHSCVTGIILDDEDKPAEGATVVVRGVSYDGVSSGKTVGKDGRFCSDAMRSEGEGEDVDQNNVKGETHEVAVRVIYAGVPFNGGKVSMPKEPATCGGGCLDLGKVKLTKDKELVAKLCTLKGKVVDNLGAPVSGTIIYAHDDAVTEELQRKLCGLLGMSCTLIATSAADGTFEFKLPVVDGATIAGTSLQGGGLDSTRIGMMTVEGCPSEPIEVKLTEGHDRYDVVVTLAAGKVSWVPARAAVRVEVHDSTGAEKWSIENLDTGLASPLTYGTLPTGATQAFPATGSPAALVSGDVISVEMDGIGADGYQYGGRGSFTVP